MSSLFFKGTTGFPIIRTGDVCGKHISFTGLDLTVRTSLLIDLATLVTGAAAADAALDHISAVWNCVRG